MLSLGDLILHWLDISFSPRQFVWISAGGVFVILAVSGINLWNWKYNHRKSEPGDNTHPLTASPQLSSKCVNSVFCTSERGIFQDFCRYVDIETSMLNLKYVDLASYIVLLCFSCASGYYAYYADSDDDGLPSFQLQATGYDYFIDRMNFASFLFIFCGPMVILIVYSVSTRNDMLRSAEDKSPVLKSADTEIERKLDCIPCCSRSCIGFWSVLVLLAERLAFFLVFEVNGIFSDAVQKLEYYMIAATIIAVFHFYLVLHTLIRRIEWYDALPEVNKGAISAPKDDKTQEPQRKDVHIPLGHDFFFSTTQLLSAALFARAVFGAFVIGFLHGPEHRGIPIFLDFVTCIVILCSSRYLVFSDYVILDLMSYSGTLTKWKETLYRDLMAQTDGLMLLQPFVTENPRKIGSDSPADKGGECVATIVMNNVFATERPIY